METLEELFQHFIQDIYYAEKAGIRAMAKIARKVENDELKGYIQEHREQSAEQVKKLEQVYLEVLGKKARGKTCAAMNGLIEECDEAMQEAETGPVLDAALIAGIQAMKHYEIARIGSLKAWALQLGHEDAANLLEEILDEDKEADQHLTDIAEQHLNPEAEEEDEEEEDEEEDEEPEEEPEEEPAPEPAPEEKPKRGSRRKK